MRTEKEEEKNERFAEETKNTATGDNCNAEKSGNLNAKFMNGKIKDEESGTTKQEVSEKDQDSNDKAEDKKTSEDTKLDEKKTSVEAAEAIDDEARKPNTKSASNIDSFSKQTNPYDELKWIVVKNDGKPESLIKLVALKSLFAKQLPKMPRTYIARLVFDRRHT